MEKLSSSLNEDNVVSYYDKLCYVVNNKYKYHLYVLNKKEYKCIKSLQKSRFILQPDSEYFLNNQYYFKYNLSNHSSEKKAIAIVAKDLFINDKNNIEFSWGGEHKLPIAKYSSRAYCTASGNTIMWTFQ